MKFANQNVEGSQSLLIDQLIKRQKHYLYLHFHVIFLSLELNSAVNYNPCERVLKKLLKFIAFDCIYTSHTF